ncbi:MAG: DUF2064 domain-containing protein [Actinobacteria bacterium]|nr:DUF2064 domain-containing protein [Actinomycetota bacterium]
MIATVLVIAKAPLPGRVKTRLVPALTFEQAAEVATAALRDTLAAVDRIVCSERILALDGPRGAWVRRGWRVAPQLGHGLDRRLGHAFGTAGRGPAVLVGMDTPQLVPEHVTAFDADRFDACLGPAVDGGFWSIGFADPRRAAGVIAGVPMSKQDTGDVQLRRLRQAGMSVQILECLEDIDTVDVLRRVALGHPHLDVASVSARLGVAVPA